MIIHYTFTADSADERISRSVNICWSYGQEYSLVLFDSWRVKEQTAWSTSMNYLL